MTSRFICKNKVTLWLLIPTSTILCGCNLGLTLTEKRYKAITDYHNYETQGEQRKRQLLNGVQFEGQVRVGDIDTSYVSGLRSQAEQIARRFNADLAYIRQETGLQTSFDRIHFYLIRHAGVVIDERGSPFFEPTNTMGVVLYVDPTTSRFDEIIASNFVTFLSTMHEITEVSLANPRMGAGVLYDVSWTAYRWIPRRDYGYTRWFRDGFAEYTACLVYERLLKEFDNKQEDPFFVPYSQKGFFVYPFSSLSKIGKDLFNWTDFAIYPPSAGPVNCLEKCPDFPGLPKTTQDYYRAALGLFLIIRERYGADAIKKIIPAIKTLKRADGPSLVQLINKTLNTDIMKLAADFRFPYAGMGLLYIQPEPINKALGRPDREGLYVVFLDPKGLAGKAGVERGDYLIEMEGLKILTEYDYEKILNSHKEQKSVKMKVYRRGKGELIVEMKLSNSG